MRRRHAVVLLFTACSGPVLAQAQAPASIASPAPANQLGEIVVTAQRRTENIQKVPLSVTALGRQQLDDARVTDIRTLSGLAPSVLLTAQGISSIPTVTIRGINSGISSSQIDPKVGIYLDGVYIGRTVGAIFDLADIERVETLRGPQGTLFGRNATAGAISLTTASPTGSFHVNGLLSGGNYGSFRGRISLDLPAFGIFSARIAYLHDQTDGDTRNLLGGKTLDLDPREPGAGTLRYADRLGARNTDAVQAAIRARPGDDLTIDYKFDYTDARTVGRPAQTVGFNSDGGGQLAAGIAAFQPLTGGTINLSRTRLDAVANATGVQPLTVMGHSLTIAGSVGPVQLKSITAYRMFNQHWNVYDLASTGGQKFSLAQLGALLTGNVPGILAPGAQPGPNDYLFDLLTVRKAKQHQVSEELQAIVSTSRFDLTAGLFYFRERGTETSILGIFQPEVNGAIVPTPFDRVFGSGVNQFAAVNASYAAYAQGSYHLTPMLDLTLGGRYTVDKRDTDIIRLGGAAAGGPLGPGDYRKTFRRGTYTAIVSYHPDANLNTYAKVASGYVSGGVADGTPYDPETLTSYEVGVKSQLFDRRLRANLAGFYSDYSDLQIQQFIGGRQIFSNAGKAHIYGAEAELDAVPARGLTLSGSLGYQHFHYVEYLLGGANVAGIARPLYAPKLTARLTGTYELPAIGDIGRPFFSADGRYRSRTYLTLLPGSNAITERGTYQTPFWLLDARIGLRDIDVAGAHFEIALYAKNLLDKNEYTFAPAVIGQNVFYDEHRTYGIEARARF